MLHKVLQTYFAVQVALERLLATEAETFAVVSQRADRWKKNGRLVRKNGQATAGNARSNEDPKKDSNEHFDRHFILRFFRWHNPDSLKRDLRDYLRPHLREVIESTIGDSREINELRAEIATLRSEIIELRSSP